MVELKLAERAIDDLPARVAQVAASGLVPFGI